MNVKAVVTQITLPNMLTNRHRQFFTNGTVQNKFQFSANEKVIRMK